jgi:peroxiredoxin
MEQVKSEGDTAPDFTLPDFQGRHVSLSEKLSSGPVVLGFFRGTW